MGCVNKVGKAFDIGQEEAGRLTRGDSVATSGQIEYLLCRDDGWVIAPAFLKSGGGFHHLDHVEVIA